MKMSVFYQLGENETVLVQVWWRPDETVPAGMIKCFVIPLDIWEHLHDLIVFMCMRGSPRIPVAFTGDSVVKAALEVLKVRKAGL